MPRLWLALASLLLLSGCADRILTQWPQPKILSTYFRLQDVKPGMSREEVEGLMGPPQVSEEGDFRGGHFVLYFYRTHNMDYEESDTVRGGYMPLIFRDNRLVGKGKRDYLRAVDRSWRDSAPPPASYPSQGSFPRRTW
ncbi:MAG: DUF3192 domain-containing protein [Desulfobaccales bacterium]